MVRCLVCFARRYAGQPPTAPMGGGFSPTRGRGLPYNLKREDKVAAGLCTNTTAQLVGRVV
ncbi:hypothetical protein SULPSESMR1_01751 [Pseudosulfitobacter pseudonitzschiae]|uniref:Uncharacterized protein n=1 Tax=Pseudosulfitobacter pseudonitzschiae TaxID=1402135 RepID=A0A221K101_9RHOB|nr:hypothetical protein SULPSESMR1_01751 [Pseudosulfitobacter pseudonitzschiae]